MIHADALLARRLEAAEATNARGCTSAPPGSTAAMLEVAGGCAIFVGAESPLTQAVGMGLNGPVSASRAGRHRGVLSQPRRQRVHRPLPAGGPRPARSAGRARLPRHRVQQRAGEAARRAAEIVLTPRVRRALPGEDDLWAYTVGHGFFEQAELTTDEMDVGRAIFAMPGALCYLAVAEPGEPAGGGALAVRDGLATLFADSTMSRVPAPRTARRTDRRAPQRGPGAGLRPGHGVHPARQHLAAQLRTAGL